jgi:hypothetical protein
LSKNWLLSTLAFGLGFGWPPLTADHEARFVSFKLRDSLWGGNLTRFKPLVKLALFVFHIQFSALKLFPGCFEPASRFFPAGPCCSPEAGKKVYLAPPLGSI